MKRPLQSLAGLLALTLAVSPVHAETEATTEAAETEAAADDFSDLESDEPDFSALAEQMAALFTDDRPEPDPEKVEIAARMTAMMIPDGTYAEMMESSMGPMMDFVSAGMMQMPLSDIVELTGVPEEELGDIGDATLGEITAIFDPHFLERQQRIGEATQKLVIDMMSEMEPVLRQALARAYAHRMSLDQLKAIEAFFATPEGAAFAAESYRINSDPEIISASMQMMPMMFERMPEMFASIAIDDLPAPKTIEDLSEEELRRLAELLGVDPDELSPENVT